MRIAFFTETFLPKVDGIVNTLCHLLDYLARAGHASLLLAPAGNHLRYAATPIIAYPGIRFPLYPEFCLVPPIVPIRRHLEAFRPDLVHVLNPISLGVSGMELARRMSIPVVASFHTDLPGFAVQWGWRLLEQPLWRALRTVHNRADLNLCPSSATLNKLRLHKFERVKLWTRGVDTQRFHPRRKTASMRYRLTSGHPGAPLILFVGRLSPEKRVELLLPVLEALPQARLAIVGDGPARRRLEAQFAGSATVFTGYLRGLALARAYAAADLFVFPAANETLGNVVLEAMASGLPVVTAAAGGPLDSVNHNRNGLLFPPHDVDALITAVARLLAAPRLRQRLGKQARQDAAARSWTAVFNKLIADYTDVVHQYARVRAHSNSLRVLC